MNGIGQCMIPASARSLIAQYHHETRSTALSIYQSGLYVGIIVAGAFAFLQMAGCASILLIVRTIGTTLMQYLQRRQVRKGAPFRGNSFPTIAEQG